ncbi:MAG TPA: four helix bundle protein [Bryobacteraceae bacterium]|nr:four helix bundle protein [Bryobacteraceae bacterium]
MFQLAYSLALEVFRETKSFPREEIYSLTDQVRRASRSVAANLAEAHRKRKYKNAFVLRVSDADAEATEVQLWLDFAKDFGYLPSDTHQTLVSKYEELGRMLGGILRSPEKFVIR